MSRLIRVAAVAIACAWTAVAWVRPPIAASFPAKPVRLISGAPPGTPADVAARAISDALAAELGQPVVVENRPGAINTIAMAAVAGAPPDGHVLGLFGMVSTLAPNLLPSLPYDTRRDLVPVAQLSWVANVLVLRADARFGSVAELIDYARANPGRLSYASGGNGTPAHVTAELFKQTAGVDLLHVPFKGAVAGVTAVIGGHVDLMFATAPAVAAHVRDRRLKAIATTAPARLPGLPDVATMAELGYPGLTVRDWNGVVAPAGTPPAVVSRLAAAVQNVLAQESVRERLRAVGLEAAQAWGPDEFRRLIDSELDRWAALVRRAGIRAD